MLLEWFNAREVKEIGTALADEFALQTAPDPRERSQATKSGEQQSRAIQRLLQRLDREARPLQLNIYRRAKLANSFKWRLREKGIEPEVADQLTGMLVLRLAAKQPPGSDSVARSGPRRNARNIQALLAQGDNHLAAGAYAQAVGCYQELLVIDRRHAGARNNLGLALCRLGQYRAAEEQFRQAIGTRPAFADAHANLGTLLRWRGCSAESEMPLRRALKLNPQHVGALVSLGVTLLFLGRLRDGKTCFERAGKIAPRHAGALCGMGQVAGFEGRFEEAEALYRHALAAEPRIPSAWAALVGLRKMSASDVGWLDDAEKIASDGLAPLEEADLRFAIGKYFDDVGDYARAFRNYQRANELQRMAAEPYERAARSHFVDDMIRIYARGSFSGREGGVSDSARPVFVVGMMRSGTTLVEQILCSHHAVRGAGELGFWTHTVQRHEAAVRRQHLGEAIKRQLAEAYLRVLAEYPAAASRVIDKTTFNADYLGVIHSVFPNARMIYVQRDPIDACLSCYFQQFSPTLNFTMDLADLAHYCREHQRLMTHWRAALPAGTLLDVPYEELVADPEPWTRRILDFLGLDWDEKCLQFQKTERPVMTASFWQVRQKIYKDSVGRWRHYRKFIAPLLDLADAGR